MESPNAMRHAIGEYARGCVDIVRSAWTSFEFDVASVSFTPATQEEFERLYGYLANQGVISDMYKWYGSTAYRFSLACPIPLKIHNDEAGRVELLPPSYDGSHSGRFVRTVIAPRYCPLPEFIKLLQGMGFKAEKLDTVGGVAWRARKDPYEVWVVRSIEAAAQIRTKNDPFSAAETVSAA